MEKKTLTVTHKKYEVHIPYIEIEGKGGGGHHIFLSGGMHGNEINGIAAIDSVVHWMEKIDIEKKLRGKITVLPLLNPSGFAHMQRNVYEDDLLSFAPKYEVSQ